MRIRLIAVGTRLPDWVQAGYREYAERLPHECRLELREISPGHRSRGAAIERAVRDEGGRILAALKSGDRVVALDVSGPSMDTMGLAKRLGDWLQDGRDIALLVGGPDGLAPACIERCELRWSLSQLTLPHGLVRIVVAEQLYRAWSVLVNHPYHRA